MYPSLCLLSFSPQFSYSVLCFPSGCLIKSQSPEPIYSIPQRANAQESFLLSASNEPCLPALAPWAPPLMTGTLASVTRFPFEIPSPRLYLPCEERSQLPPCLLKRADLNGLALGFTFCETPNKTRRAFQLSHKS